MLKIKDNVDLKKLEKFGFKLCGCSYMKEYYDGYATTRVIIDDERFIYIQNDNYDNDFCCELPDVVYELIKADLVEKIDIRYCPFCGRKLYKSDIKRGDK